MATAVHNLGTLQAAHYAVQRVRDRIAPSRVFTVRSRYARFPLRCRHGSSDIDVFRQIFVEREYRCLDALGEVGLVIDCGAYVGYSAAYFLTRFPTSRVLAVEPDPANFALLSANVAPYGERIRCLRVGVWSHATTLSPSGDRLGDGREWAVRFREARPGERPTTPAVGIPALIGEERVSVLKMDIEGAELEVFRGDCAWLERVDNFVAELHDDAAESAFARAVAGRGFDLSRCDELVVGRRVG